MKIAEYSDKFKEQVIALILSIQRDELGVKITVNDQPDLQDICHFYQVGNGNFWIALDEQQVGGTIALIDIGNREVVLRKMFVSPAFRGKEKGAAQLLMNRVFEWCRQKKIDAIYLGTIDIMKAAHRFYEKNGFTRIEKEGLPPGFPLMKVDNVFYKYSFSHTP
jgi:GNAT superfamily N-acetyltransferase